MAMELAKLPGIGPKTAGTLVQQYETIDYIYDHLDELEIKEGVRKKLAAGEESARKSYWLATILCDVPMDFEPEQNRWDRSFRPELYELFRRLGFQ